MRHDISLYFHVESPDADATFQLLRFAVRHFYFSFHFIA